MAYKAKTGFTSPIKTELHADYLVLRQGPNFVTDTGGSNALAATLTDIVGGVIDLTDGMSVYIRTVNTLQKGSNTFNLNGKGAKNIRSNHDASSNIETATEAGVILHLVYDKVNDVWQAMGLF